ncbi:unnamed protein product [Lathyrus sativus]|nr:unnamed protein product [Lathyrus sativus]
MEVSYGPSQHVMNNRMIPRAIYPTPNALYHAYGRNQPIRRIQPTYVYVQDNYFSHYRNNINHTLLRDIVSTPGWFDTYPERNQSRQSIQTVLPPYVQDNHFIHHENNINHILVRREMIPTYRWSNTYIERNQPRLSTRDVFSHDVYVQDGHYVLHENNINQAPIRRYIVPTHGWSNINFERNQPRLSTRNLYPVDAYVQNNHSISHENNINHVPVRRDIMSTQRWFDFNPERSQSRWSIRNVLPTYANGQDNHSIRQENNINQVPVRRGIRNNTNLERNQARLNTQEVLSTDVNVQDDHFIFPETIINQAPARRDIKVTKGCYGSNFEIIRVEEGTKDSEVMTCSICLEELLVGSKAIQLSSPCLHIYHEDCILKWLDISNTCPLCRRYIQ